MPYASNCFLTCYGACSQYHLSTQSRNTCNRSPTGVLECWKLSINLFQISSAWYPNLSARQSLIYAFCGTFACTKVCETGLNAPQLAKYARPAAQKGYASYAKGLAQPFCATMCNYPTYFFRWSPERHKRLKKNLVERNNIAIFAAHLWIFGFEMDANYY